MRELKLGVYLRSSLVVGGSPGSSWHQRYPAGSGHCCAPIHSHGCTQEMHRPCVFSRQLLPAKLCEIWPEFKAIVLLAIHWGACFHWQRTAGNDSSSQWMKNKYSQTFDNKKILSEKISGSFRAVCCCAQGVCVLGEPGRKQKTSHTASLKCKHTMGFELFRHAAFFFGKIFNDPQEVLVKTQNWILLNTGHFSEQGKG